LLQSKLHETKWMDRVYIDDQMNKEILQLLMDMDPESNTNPDLYERTIDKFIMIENEHLNEEEDNVFPALREKMTSTELAQLEDDLERAKRTAPTRPHPRAPITGAKILFPIVGTIDRTVDSMIGRTSEVTQQ
jgi:hemerythrin superfamily protein